MTCPCCGYDENLADPKSVLDALNLSKMERRVAERLCRSFGHYVSREMLIQAIYGDDPNGGPLQADNAVSVFVLRLRRKLAPTNLAIHSRMGRESDGRKLCFRNAARTLTNTGER